MAPFVQIYEDIDRRVILSAANSTFSLILSIYQLEQKFIAKYLIICIFKNQFHSPSSILFALITFYNLCL